jgi:lipopolysaccharide assembly outer membrane protein LptD (OstA)
MLRTSSIVLALVAAVLWPSDASAQNVFTACPAGKVGLTYAGDEPTATGRRLSGPVHIVCGTLEVWADSLELPTDQALPIIATGNVVFVDQEFRVSAARAAINRQTKLGTFDQFAGWAKLTERQVEKSQFGTMEPDVVFWGERIERTGERTYKLTKGGFTTCRQPTKRWEIYGTKGTVTLDERVTLTNAVIRVKGVPLFYLPFMYYPLEEDDRSTGFLLPNYSTSTYAGAGLRNAFFWAINRSQDATLYHDWFSKSGQKYGGEYRYIASPGSDGNVTFLLFNEKEQFAEDGVTVIRPASRSFETQGSISQALPRGFRLVGRANYAQDLATRQLYNQNVADFSNRERYFGATITGSFARAYRLLANVEQRDYFYGTDTGERRGNLPRINLNLADRPLGRSRVYAGASGELLHLVYQQNLNLPDTDLSFWKYGVAPNIRATVSTLPYLGVTTSAQWLFTRWQESYDPLTNTQVPVPLTRSMLRLNSRVVGPVLQRAWDKPDSTYASRIKHVIEPSVSFDWWSPFADAIRVPRADSDQQLGGTMTISYGVTNTILARKPLPNAPPGSRGVNRNILVVSVGQSYYTDAFAAIYDPNYQSAQAPTNFSPVSIRVDTTPTDELSANFTVDIDAEFKVPRTFGASGTVHQPLFDVSGTWSKRQYIPGLLGFDNPAGASHAMGANVTIRTRSNTLGGSYGMNFDIQNKTFVQQRIVAYYNAQCCGISIDYQAMGFANFGVPVPADRRLGISFTLAGVGTFQNPFGAFGNNSQGR